VSEFRPLSLEDIAQKAGVSRSTVSRVINDEPYVSERTRTKVLRVIEAEGYRPNQTAQSLARGRTQLIGVVLPYELGGAFDDSYYIPTLLKGVTETVNRRDYANLLWWGDEHLEGERFHQRVLQNGLMDGLFIASAPTDGSLLDWLLRLRAKFVMVERPIHSADVITYVTVDNIAASLQVMRHLIGLGRRRIAHIAGKLTNVDAQDRLAAYRMGLEEAGLPYDPALVGKGEWQRERAYRITKDILNAKPDAIFAAHDQMGVGVIHAVQDAGLRVPDDIAVVGFDDLPSAMTSSPTLTTVRQPVYEKGKRATELLLDSIEGIGTYPQHILLPVELVVRESCGGKSVQNIQTGGDIEVAQI
jgi:LacI family transcriptional regulator